MRREGGCGDDKGELFIREGGPVHVNRASGSGASKANDSGFSSNDFAGMTDGTIGVDNSQYKAHYKLANVPARYGVNLGAVFRCSGMRFASTRTNARPKTFQVQWASADSATASDWTTLTITGKTDQTDSFSGNKAVAMNADGWQGVSFAPISAQFWAALFVDDVYNVGDNDSGISEIEFICE